MDVSHLRLTIIRSIVFVACSVMAFSSVCTGEKFAVIVVAEEAMEATAPDGSFLGYVGLPFWNDSVLTYDMLRENGFDRENIFVLYGDGDDFESDIEGVPVVTREFEPSENMVDFKVDQSEIQRVFECLSDGNSLEGSCAEVRKLTGDDFLILFWTGHANGPPDNILFQISNDSDLDVGTLAGWMDLMKFNRRVFIFTTCRAGGIRDHFQTPNTENTVLMPACGYDGAPAFGEFGGIEHNPWTYWVASGLRELLPSDSEDQPDSDDNSLVSIHEVDAWARDQIPLPSPGLEPDYPPEISDPNEISPCLFVRMENPGDDAELFSRDHIRDDSTVPSNTEPWFHGPDLWIRRNHDWETTAEEPIYGDINHVYATVHNIGCDAFSDVVVNFFWSEPSSWCDISNWTPIGYTGPFPLEKAESVTVHVDWVDVPLPGSYCLHSKVGATGDMPNADSRAYLDDNKVQANIVVLSGIEGGSSSGYFFVENHAPETVAVDLVVDVTGLPNGAQVRVELPPSAVFSDLFGGHLGRTSDGWFECDFPADLKRQLPSERRWISGIEMQPGTRFRGLFSIGLPATLDSSDSVEFTVSQVVKGEVVGGIRFVAVPASPRELTCDLSLAFVRVLRRLASDFSIDHASDLADRISTDTSLTSCAGLAGLRPLSGAGSSDFRSVADALRYSSPVYGNRLKMAIDRLDHALTGHDLQGATSAAKECLLYLTIILSEL